MKQLFFRILFGVDALICAIVFGFFLFGLADGWISAFNIEIWIAILTVLSVILVGSLWLKAAGHPVLGILLLLVLTIPGILFGLFVLLIIATDTQWN